MKKRYTAILAFLFIGFTAISSYGKNASYEAWVIFTAFDTVSSHGGGYDVERLKHLSHQENTIDRSKTSALLAALEKSKIGKSTAAERRQMHGPIYLAIFRSDYRRRPVYVSNGCHVLNLKTGDLYRLDAETAVLILGVSQNNYETRLCKEPGLGITLSPR